MTDEIEVGGVPVCVWGVYVVRSNGRKTLRWCLGHRVAERAKARIKLEPGDTVSLVKFDREDRRTPKNNGGGYR